MVATEFTNGFDIPLATPHKPVGCIECRQTGFVGRVGLYEMMEMTPNLKPLIQNETNLEDLKNQTLHDGLVTLRMSGAKKVSDGLTTIGEVLRVTPFN